MKMFWSAADSPRVGQLVAAVVVDAQRRGGVVGERREVDDPDDGVGGTDLGDLDGPYCLGAAEQVGVIGHDERATRGAQGDGRADSCAGVLRMVISPPTAPVLLTRLALMSKSLPTNFW